MPEENKEKTQKKRWTLKKVKTRCRTIYWQNFLLTASVVMLTLALLGSAFFALTYSYAIDERSEQMQSKATVVSHMVSSYMENGSLTGLRELADFASNVTDAEFLICNSDGNLLLTMLLGGLWHGAAVRFILWGGLHGAALALHKLWMALVPGAKATGAQMHWWSRAAGMLLTFNIVCLGWLMFRAESMQTVSLMLHQIFENFNAAMIPQVVTGYAAVFALIAAGYILHLLPSAVDAVAQRIVVHAPLVLQVLMAAAMIWCVMQIKSSDIQPFIYFQF